MEEDSSASPDSVGGSMLPALKKDKICLVCGDKALGYNFNAVSCESCKAFFRRNAHKTIRGRCEGKCDVNIESRSFCKRCRLAKCFTVGMRKDMILDDDQKKMRKQKILINKLRRRGSFPPEDTYAVSETDLKNSYNQKIVKSSKVALKKQYPNLSDEEISCLQNIKSDESGGGFVKTEENAETMGCEQWDDLKDNLKDILSRMDEKDSHILSEMNTAHKNSSFLANSKTQLKSLPTTPTEMFNIADGFVRRIIKVVKQLDFFKRICKEDQIAMLKGSVVEIMVLRSAVNFDVKTETWTLNTAQRLNPEVTPGTSSAPDTPKFTANTPPGLPGNPPGLLGNPPGLLGNPPGFPGNPPDVPGNPPGLAGMPGGLNIEELRKAAQNGADINDLRELARKRAEFCSNGRPVADNNYNADRPIDLTRSDGSGLNISQLRSAAMRGADINTLREMAKRQGNTDENINNYQQRTNPAPDSRLNDVHVDKNAGNIDKAAGNIDQVRNAAQSAGLNIDALRNAAMNGASFEDLARMARGEKVEVKNQSESGESSSNISAEILKMGNSETKTMFLTYSKFIRSLMKTIHGDTIVLKLMIMLSLFSSDRAEIQNRAIVEVFQENYAHVLQNYIKLRFPENKNMFAQCIMKLTDLRNVNEVHTKMLLKLQIKDIEPLLIEIFDLPS